MCIDTRSVFLRLSLLLCIALLLVLTGSWIVAVMKPSAETRRVEFRSNQHFAALERRARKLKVGMTKTEVEACLGRPDNSDTEYVWFWVSAETHLTNKVLWVDHFNDDDGRLILFYRDKLLSTLLKNTEATPWDYFKTAFASNMIDVELILGPRPRIVTQ